MQEGEEALRRHKVRHLSIATTSTVDARRMVKVNAEELFGSFGRIKSFAPLRFKRREHVVENVVAATK